MLAKDIVASRCRNWISFNRIHLQISTIDGFLTTWSNMKNVQITNRWSWPVGKYYKLSRIYVAETKKAQKLSHTVW